jgi:predicted outer membrane protein
MDATGGSQPEASAFEGGAKLDSSVSQDSTSPIDSTAPVDSTTEASEGSSGDAAADVAAEASGDSGVDAAPDSAGEAGGDGAACDAGSIDLEAAAALPGCPIPECEVATMRAAIAGELTEAQVAQSRATSPAVIAFANQMAANYAQYNQNLSAYETSAAVSEQTCAQSTQLNGVAGQALSAMQAAGANAFDSVYLQSQIVSLQSILDVINGEIFGCVNDSALKALIRAQRKTVPDGGQPAGIAIDLHTAQALFDALNDAGASDAGHAGDASSPSDAADGG